MIGSEVPIPGGATEQEDRISVTNPEDLRETLAIYLEELNARLHHDGDDILPRLL